MRRELEQLIQQGGGFPSLDRWARRWQVVFYGTAGYDECLKQAWIEVERREAIHGGKDNGASDSTGSGSAAH